MIEHPDNVAFQPLSVLAAHAGTHPSVFVRLAQGIGFGGFSQIQAIARRRLTTPEFNERSSGRQDALSLAIASRRATLARLDGGTDRARLRRVMDLLTGAETIFLTGGNRAGLAMAQFARSLTLSGIRNMAACGDGDPFGCNLAFASERDAVVAADITPPDPLLPTRIAGLKQRGVPVVLMIDTRMHPAVDLDIAWLEAPRNVALAEHGWSSFECLCAAVVEGIRSHRQTRIAAPVGCYEPAVQIGPEQAGRRDGPGRKRS